MKVIAHFQFYLPYLLPRHADWKGRSLQLATDDFEITIMPRDPEEPVILENDRFVLSTRLITRSVADIHSSKAKTPEDECCDRLHVAVLGTVIDKSTLKDRSVKDQFLGSAMGGANIFIDHCRILSAQPGMTRLTRTVTSAEITSPQFPYSLWWRNAETGEWYSGTGSGGSSSVLLHNPVSWTDLDKQVAQSIRPDLAKLLVLDARLRFNEESFPEAVLFAAMACEVASNLYIERAGEALRAEAEKILEMKVSFAEKRFHLITSRFSSQSYKDADPAGFRTLERLYRVRNTVVHEGFVAEENHIAGPASEAKAVQTFVDAAQKAVKWMSGLEASTGA